MAHSHDVVVIGGGQAGLATGWYLHRTGLSHVILDGEPLPGGSWRRHWQSLQLFSPASTSSLPGWAMPPFPGDDNPDAPHVVDYLTRYEQRYRLPVQRPVRVDTVRRTGDGFEVRTDRGVFTCRAVICATGTFRQPFVPVFPGMQEFAGEQLHSSGYLHPAGFAGRRVLVVGGANSGAQITADLLPHAATVLWATLDEPRFLPDDVDGRELFRVASLRVRALQAGRPDPGGVGSLGDVIVTPPIRRVRDAGLLTSRRMPERLTATGARWADGSVEELDAVIWCTGFRPALRHLRELPIREPDGRIRLTGTAVDTVPGLHLVGYGDWVWPGSATLIGAGQNARARWLRWDKGAALTRPGRCPP